MVSDREKAEPVFSKVLIKKFVNQLGILTHTFQAPKISQRRW
jgi:hypothetical protein